MERETEPENIAKGFRDSPDLFVLAHDAGRQPREFGELLLCQARGAVELAVAAKMEDERSFRRALGWRTFLFLRTGSPPFCEINNQRNRTRCRLGEAETQTFRARSRPAFMIVSASSTGEASMEVCILAPLSTFIVNICLLYASGVAKRVASWRFCDCTAFAYAWHAALVCVDKHFRPTICPSSLHR